MKNIGSTLLILGVGSIVLNFFNYEFRLLMWVDMWGETVGWAIRGAVIVAGAGMFFIGGRSDQDTPSVAAQAPRQEPTMQAPAPAAPPAAPPAAEPAAGSGAGTAEVDSGADAMGSLRNP